jgi:cytochrome P450
VPVPAGAEVAVLLGAANRDPLVFAAPDVFDIGRDPNPHLGFGAGLHFCLGAPLARVEMRAALTALAERRPGLEMIAEPPQRPTFVLRSFHEVRLKG